jgi:hypothetical protein
MPTAEQDALRRQIFHCTAAVSVVAFLDIDDIALSARHDPANPIG